MKKLRQHKILEIINNHKIDTQDELIKRLAEFDIIATQATLSRDIKELKLIKVNDGKSGYYYAMPNTKKTDPVDVPRTTHSLSHLIISVDNAMNIVVIKTHAGMAQAVATGIDHMDSSMILGCVAGDDTIMVVTATPEDAKATAIKISSMVVENR